MLRPQTLLVLSISSGFSYICRSECLLISVAMSYPEIYYLDVYLSKDRRMGLPFVVMMYLCELKFGMCDDRALVRNSNEMGDSTSQKALENKNT